MCPQVLVPDSSVLINLDHLGCFSHFELLRSKNSWKVIVPSQVMSEAGPALSIRMMNVVTASSVITDIAELTLRFPQLGPGELGVLCLGIEMRQKGTDCALILDDRRARKTAQELGFRPFGTMRLLYLMHETKQITKAELLQLYGRLKQFGFWFDEEVVRRVLSE